ncbi:Hypothetical Protein FCC1311_094382 [Hondaea fermentalgiana]|uniref:Protein phosphatase inhibitor 2 n=1 Tax=Hondaea fermentalgiana TaxID=2315210 RepID=A0A2R5GYX9_9STRA|nr:Hypothetical Protein FCC1311_094382 [Hondaea fermentalgiana]|eukprot:GBG33214.1 Hypothetical Protein FCC1311_094382 [Hondaea fermentalgiana]
MPFFSLTPKGRGGAAGEEDDDPEGSRHVRWDEATIAEHDKLRGTRQKIDEPDTPFHRDSFDSEADEDFEEDGDSAVKVVFEDGVKPGGATAPTSHAPTDMLDMDALQSQLDKAATADSDDARPAAAQKSAHDDFVSKRKQHYNEIEALRRWRQEHPDGDEDEDLDDDDEDA